MIRVLRLLYYQPLVRSLLESYFYIAIMLVDLDVTYRWRTYVHARPLIHYPLLTSCIMLAPAGLSIDLVTQLTGINYPTFECVSIPTLRVACQSHKPALRGTRHTTSLDWTALLSPRDFKLPLN